MARRASEEYSRILSELDDASAKGSAKNTRLRRRGVTLVELLVVIALIGLITATLISGMSGTASAKLGRSTTTLTGAIRVSYFHATARSKTSRIVFDLDNGTYWLEESESPVLVQTKAIDPSGASQAALEAEKTAQSEGERLTMPPPVAKPMFLPARFTFVLDDSNAKKDEESGRVALLSGIRFKSVQTAHDDVPRTSGRAVLYFWPGGQTEQASIQLQIGKAGEVSDGAVLTIETAPLTGKATVKSGAQELKLPENDEAASEREDPGR